LRIDRSTVILDCGGKRSATPLLTGAEILMASVLAKAPLPLRSAGAVQAEIICRALADCG
jgi:hypothetical protein